MLVQAIHDFPQITQVVAEPELEAISLAPGPVFWSLEKGHRMNRSQWAIFLPLHKATLWKVTTDFLVAKSKICLAPQPLPPVQKLWHYCFATRKPPVDLSPSSPQEWLTASRLPAQAPFPLSVPAAYSWLPLLNTITYTFPAGYPASNSDTAV